MVDASGFRDGGRWFRGRENLPKRKLAKGTVRRIVLFAAPYKRMLVAFLALIIVDAVVGAVQPLLMCSIVNHIVSRQQSVLIQLALLIAGLAVFDAGLSLAMRYYSSR